MTIGEALKEERTLRKKTQEEWIRGTTLSVSHYSKIEHGKNKINADDLFYILEKNNIVISDFYEKLSTVNYKLPINNVSEQLAEAFYENDLSKVERIKRKINSESTPTELKYHAILVEAALKGNIKDLDFKLKQKIIQEIFEKDDWTLDQGAIRLFGRSMELFTHEQLTIFMNTIFKRYNHINYYSAEVQERVATITINYLYNDYQYVSKEQVLKCIEFVKKMPNIPRLAIHKIISRYYELKILEKDHEKNEIKKILEDCGFVNILKKIS